VSGLRGRLGIGLTAAAMLAIAVGVPMVAEPFDLLQLTVFAAMCILALSLGVEIGRASCRERV